jgi:uncharacterized protein YcsI (UPF0317 family)
MATTTVQGALAGAAPTGLAARLLIRRGGHPGTTSALAPGFVQANLAILPRSLADDFRRFCALNPKPCPLIGTAAPGDWRMPELGRDLDLRTDLPRYRVWRDGAVADEPRNLHRWWRDDLVSFAIGCSFSFEQALMDEGIEVRHIACNCTVPMYRTSIETVQAGVFRGPLVVSMRPFSPADAIRAIEITSRYPLVHGAPVHLGKPELIGIADLATPDYGDAVPVGNDEIPLFWACGVTPQSAIAVARPEFCITHYPGAMLVTDIRDSALRAS